ncbi:MAG: EamA family transporter [[Clostridium] leptum]
MMKGYLAIIAASLLYGIMPVLSKLLLLEGMNSSSIVVWRFCFSTVFCLAIMLIKKDPVSGNPQTNRRYDSGRNIRIWYDGHSGDSRL